MKLRLLLPILAAFLAAAPFAQAQKMKDAVAQIHRERIQASYLLAFGRTAFDPEVAHWVQHNPKSVADLVAHHKEYLQRDEGTHRDTIRRSYLDAFGTPPKDGDYAHWMSGADTYTELMKKHIDWLKNNPAQYEEVLRRSYQNVLRRKAEGSEIAYWKSQGTFSYIVLAACHEDWAKRNGAAALETSGKPMPAKNSRYLTTLPVSPAIANEALAAARLIGNDAGSIVGNAAGNIVAAGAGNLVAAGGGNIVAAGAGN